MCSASVWRKEEAGVGRFVLIVSHETAHVEKMKKEIDVATSGNLNEAAELPHVPFQGIQSRNSRKEWIKFAMRPIVLARNLSKSQCVLSSTESKKQQS